MTAPPPPATTHGILLLANGGNQDDDAPINDRTRLESTQHTISNFVLKGGNINLDIPGGGQGRNLDMPGVGLDVQLYGPVAVVVVVVVVCPRK